MIVRPILAHGAVMLRLMLAVYCVLGCAIVGLILVWKAKKTSLWLVGAALCLLSLVFLILVLANYENL
jgi:hypothetical protein